MTKPLNLLVVEDDHALRDALLVTLDAAGHKASGAADGPAALALIARNRYNMVVSDLRMAPMDGLELLGEIRSRHPGLPVLLMTAFGDVDKAVAAMRGGACDFMLKPFEPRALLDLLLLASRVAKADATVLLTGESGTGKEVFARYIHDQSNRKSGPFVAINCAAIPDNLLEATLFGHEKGAFTGAQGAQAGKFEQASGGTLLLDEISEMPMTLQAKLLRVLQEREVERVGGKKPIAVDLRVIATSNRDMAAEVKAGRFREDLFYRLNVFPLQIPALRERPADIVPLARHFCALHGARLGRVVRLSSAAEAKIAAYAWPGNVRELENLMQRAIILAPGDTVEGTQLMFEAGGTVYTPSLPVPTAEPPVTVFVPQPLVPDAAPIQPLATQPANIKDLERAHILETLAKVGGSRKKAVELLGISERTLRYKLAQYRDEGFLPPEE
jgi:two-component system response regulator FlrC